MKPFYEFSRVHFRFNSSTDETTMTQELYQNAMKFAGEMHKNQLVPGTNANYLLHISNVTMEVLMAHKVEESFDLDFAMQVAILHDTIEDTEATYEMISDRFGARIADGVQALTKDESLNTKAERMADSLNRISALEKEVGIVKLADRITNLQAPPPHWSPERIAKYAEEAKLISKQLANKNVYLNQRLDERIKVYQQNL